MDLHIVACAYHLATPIFTHHPITIAAAEGGKHVMCEKPLGLDAEEAASDVPRHADAQLVDMMAFTYRFAPSTAIHAALAQEW